MPADAPRISTIVPLYNGAATIERTLRSACGQSVRDLEILVVNDGSTDDGPRIVEAMAREDARIRLIAQPNRGLPSARNAGLAHARGRHVHFLDADDTIDPRAYEKLLPAVNAGDTGAAVAGHEVRTAEGVLIDTNLPNRDVVTLDDLVDRVGFVCHAPLLRRATIADLRFDERLRSYEDLDFWLRLGERGVRWTVVNEPLVTYVMHPGSMSRNVAVMLDAAHDVLTRLFERQAALPPEQRRIDASPERLARRLRHFALSYATQTVMLRGEDAVDEAVALFADAKGDKRISPDEAAEKAHHAFTYALARSYDDDLEREAEVLVPVGAFWRRGEARGWAEPGLAPRARAHLELIRHEHTIIAGAILDELMPVRRITIVGYGRNGTRLAALARERGIGVTIRDDRLDPVGPPAPGHPPVAPMDAPLHPGEPVVLTPLDDGALMARFAHAPRLIRWSDVRRGLLTPDALPAA